MTDKEIFEEGEQNARDAFIEDGILVDPETNALNSKSDNIHVVQWTQNAPNRVMLAGFFGADELEAIAWWMRNKQ